MDCKQVVIGDPLYESVIKELIEAGDIVSKCQHGDEHPCQVCRGTWVGCKDNARAVMKGKGILRGDNR